MNRRFLTAISTIIAIIFLPYWIYVPLLIFGMAIFPFYWEAILLGFLIDVLYGENIISLWSLASSSAFLVLVGLLILMPLRERLRTHV